MEEAVVFQAGATDDGLAVFPGTAFLQGGEKFEIVGFAEERVDVVAAGIAYDDSLAGDPFGVQDGGVHRQRRGDQGVARLDDETGLFPEAAFESFRQDGGIVVEARFAGHAAEKSPSDVDVCRFETESPDDLGRLGGKGAVDIKAAALGRAVQVNTGEAHMRHLSDPGDSCGQFRPVEAEAAVRLVFRQGDVDPQADGNAVPGRHSGEPVQFPLAVDIDDAPGLERFPEAGFPLDGAVENDVVEAQGPGQPVFGVGDDFGRRAGFAQDGQHGRVGVGLDRVSDTQRPEPLPERFGEALVVGFERIGVKHEAWCAEGFRIHGNSL